MEKHKSCRQQGRKKVDQLSMSNNAAGGGGGIEGVVILGGALAIASLIAAFTIKKCNRKDSNKEDTTNLTATDSCRKKEEDGNGTEGLRFILHEPSSTLHQKSCCINHGTSKIFITEIETCELVSPQSLISSEENSVSGHQEILIHDTEQESIAMTGDIEEISRPENDHKPMNLVENESNGSSVKETIEIEIDDEAVNADAEQAIEEMSSTEEEKSSFSTREEDEVEYSLLMQSSFSAEEQDEEEYSPIRSSFSTEEDDEEENSPMESSFSKEEEEEEDPPLQSSFSTEEDDENGENVTEMEEESSEGTWSSSTESNMEAIWPAEMMGVLLPEPKEINISHRITVKKFEEKGATGKIEDHLANAFDESGSNINGKKQKETQKLIVVMNDQKEHSAKRRIWWVWLGLVLLLLLLLANCLLQPNYLSNTVSIVFPIKQDSALTAAKK